MTRLDWDSLNEIETVVERHDRCMTNTQRRSMVEKTIERYLLSPEFLAERQDTRVNK